MYTIVGLGNPGAEYEYTRHNMGRILVTEMGVEKKFPEFVSSSKYAGHISKGEIKKELVTLLLPDTFMNKSGSSVATLVSSIKKAKELIVVYDDIDLPIGTLRVSFGRSSGGHRGVESIIKTLKTKDFTRIRIGVAPKTPGGKIRKPTGENGVVDFLMGEFTKKERELFPELTERVGEAVEVIIKEGPLMAMSKCNHG